MYQVLYINGHKREDISAMATIMIVIPTRKILLSNILSEEVLSNPWVLFLIIMIPVQATVGLGQT